jgi:hypothetical protein
VARYLLKGAEDVLRNCGWIPEGPFLPLSIGEGHFVVMVRKKGTAIDDMYNSIVEVFAEQIPMVRV